MFPTANYADSSSWAIFLVIALIFLNPIASAVPIRDALPPSTSIEQDFNADDSLPQGHQVHIDKRNEPGLIDADTSWPFPGESLKYAFGGKDKENPSITLQNGIVSFYGQLREGGQGSVYESTIYQFAPVPISVSRPLQLHDICNPVGIPPISNVAAKLSKSDSGCSMIRKISQIDDPHIPKYYLCTTLQEASQPQNGDQRVITVMEKLGMDGFDMWDNYVKKDDEEFDRRGMLVEASEGLLKAHEKGIAHMDIKPENLMFGETWKIIDWESAIDFSDGVKIKKHVGTENYECPGEFDLSLP